MAENFRIVAENNLTRFMDRLHVETDPAQRELFRRLLLGELRWYGAKDKRLEVLQRHLCNCTCRISIQRGVTNGPSEAEADVPESGILMNNLIDIQELLRDAIRKELNGC